MTIQTRKKTEPKHEHSLKILATRINLANAANYNQFVCFTLFDVEEPETYTCAIQDLNTAK